ncbi:MAG TPA: hypothetical protein GX717_06175 [Clostridiaceae bacterium]|nr:hypothetical protein [Clostridiaceae bacterium]
MPSTSAQTERDYKGIYQRVHLSTHNNASLSIKAFSDYLQTARSHHDYLIIINGWKDHLTSTGVPDVNDNDIEDMYNLLVCSYAVKSKKDWTKLTVWENETTKQNHTDWQDVFLSEFRDSPLVVKPIFRESVQSNVFRSLIPDEEWNTDRNSLPMCLPLENLAGYINQLYKENDHDANKVVQLIKDDEDPVAKAFNRFVLSILKGSFKVVSVYSLLCDVSLDRFQEENRPYIEQLRKGLSRISSTEELLLFEEWLKKADMISKLEFNSLAHAIEISDPRFAYLGYDRSDEDTLIASIEKGINQETKHLAYIISITQDLEEGYSNNDITSAVNTFKYAFERNDLELVKQLSEHLYFILHRKVKQVADLFAHYYAVDRIVIIINEALRDFEDTELKDEAFNILLKYFDLTALN